MAKKKIESGNRGEWERRRFTREMIDPTVVFGTSCYKVALFMRTAIEVQCVRGAKV